MDRSFRGNLLSKIILVNRSFQIVIALLGLVLPSSSSFAQHTAVSFNTINILYAGIPNPITIVAENTNSNDVIVKTNFGKITPDENSGVSHYYYESDMPGMATISVYVKTKNGLKKSNEFNCRVNAFPLPVVRLAGKKEGYISRAMLCVQIAPQAVLEGFFSSRFAIIKFKVIVTRGSKIIFEKILSDEHGVRFDDETKNVFCYLVKNDVVRLTEVVAKGPDGKNRTLNDLKLVIE